SLLKCVVYILQQNTAIAKLSANWNGKEFVAVYNPLKAGSYDVNATVIDPINELSASMLKPNLFSAFPIPVQSQVQLPEKKSFSFLNITDVLNGLFNAGIKDMLFRNTELIIGLILLVGIALLIRGGGRRGSSSRRRRR
ncbi:MAG: hypothetical protein ACP5O5_07780, partial [Fervidicoccaceae archaeon]